MTDAYLAREIVSACFWFATTVSLLLICEIMLGESVRDYLKRFRKKDDAGEGSK